MKRLHSKTLINGGFVTILILLFVITGLWVNDALRNKERLARIVVQEKQRDIVSTMRDAAQKRAILLHRMIDIEDPFDRDEEFMLFRDVGSIFVGAREKLIAAKMTPAEDILWQKTRDVLKQGGPNQRKVADFIQDEEIEQAQILLFDKVDPTLNNFISRISDLFEYKSKLIELELFQAKNDNETTFFLISLLAGVALLMGVFSHILVRSTAKTESELMEQGIRIQSMYEATVVTGTTRDENLAEMLRLGCGFFNMALGKISQISVENNTNQIIKLYSANPNTLTSKTIVPLTKTFCQFVPQIHDVLAFSDVEKTEYNNSESHKFSQIRSYIATTIVVDGELFGTVSFSSPNKRPYEFTETDKSLINLIGSWISVTLEREFHELKLRSAKEDAEAANKTKSVFLANMSHELRTPLNAIIGYSELLNDEVHRNQHDIYKPDLEKISSSGYHLLSLINDILDLAKIEAGKMGLYEEDIEVQELIDEISIIVKPLMKKNHNSFTFNVDASLKDIHSDKTKLKQVLINLLNNSAKFTDQGNVTLDVNGINKNGSDWLEITITDTGIGMKKDQIDHVFKEFNQADLSITSKYGGTGLGLAICRHMCRIMGGDINISSKFNEGTTCTVLLPISIEQQVLAS